LGYPIWSFTGIDINNLGTFIERLTALANPVNKGTNESKIAAEIGKMFLQTPSAADNLAKLLSKENAPKAMEDFLTDFENGAVLNLAKEINVQDILLDVRRQVGSGEALWLWDQETGEEELRKLILDYKIVLASNSINQKANSLSACLGEWQEKTKSIKTPVAALISELPLLKIFFEILREIAATGEFPYEKRAAFLAKQEKNADAFKTFLTEKTGVFTNTYSFYLSGFSDEEINTLYSKLPFDSFILDKSDFEKRLAALAEQLRAEQEKYRLHCLWEEKTASKTPMDWADKYKTPPLALVPQALQGDSRRAFDAINRNNPENAEVKFALNFLQSKAVFFSDLSDKSKIDVAFVRDIIGRFIVMLPNVDEVRSHLEGTVTTSPYDWYGDPIVRDEVEKLAKSKYNLGGSDKVLARIEKMDAEKAKEYLKRLIKDNMNVGIEIISDEGNA
jgi:hypothetical protein